MKKQKRDNIFFDLTIFDLYTGEEISKVKGFSISSLENTARAIINKYR